MYALLSIEPWDRKTFAGDILQDKDLSLGCKQSQRCFAILTPIPAVSLLCAVPV